MPRTPLQKAVFGVLMALAMIYGMEVYNAVLRGAGLSGSVLEIPTGEMLRLCIIINALEILIAGPLARRTARGLVDPQSRPGAFILALSTTTVCCMCPMMSLVAVILFKGTGRPFLSQWAQTVALNFPMALGWQLAVAGPLVRLLFRKLFAAQLRASSPA